MKRLERISGTKFENLENFELKNAFKIKGGSFLTGSHDKGQSADHAWATNPDANGMGKRDQADGDGAIRPNELEENIKSVLIDGVTFIISGN